ncbi:MAG TPA: FCD domain-containing protein [Candidatus Dormibacteraeota bacterium]|jgi:DNA-binding FadR family transcriptional regulator|nr:FCD domain-containing protein [Candidatus Dormibacteraeota bacterium]
MAAGVLPAREPVPRQRVVNPTLAEMIAGLLRDRILSGEIVTALPRQEDLVAEFRVSPPSVREALRILQAEGLVTVKRGSVGGALVHVPRPAKVAYMLGMILQSRNAVLEDVGAAMGIMEPACAASCAGREDRHSTIVPILRTVLEESRHTLEDPFEYMRLSLRFHEEIVAGCTNVTMTVMIGALDSLLSAHLQALARRDTSNGVFHDHSTRVRSLDEHARLLGAIERGDPAEAERLARTHLSDPTWRTRILGRDRRIQAGVVRDT